MLEAGLEILVQPVCTGPDVQHTKLVPVFLVSDARPTWSTPKPILRSNVTAPMGGHCVTVQVLEQRKDLKGLAGLSQLEEELHVSVLRESRCKLGLSCLHAQESTDHQVILGKKLAAVKRPARPALLD
ncbi:uncharacterized protein ACIB01_003912 isoform 2-T3 [Guaruba guarouba]